MIDSWRSKADGLLAKAAHPETPIEEARTAAMLLVRLMVAHDLTLTAKRSLGLISWQQWVPSGARHISTSFDSHCKACGGNVYAGMRVWWVRGVGVYCSECEHKVREGAK